MEDQLTVALLAGELRLLEMIASGSPLGNVLEALCGLVQAIGTGSTCSILLIDPNGKFRHGAGPALPPGYDATAIYQREPEPPTMFENLSAKNPARKLLEPQSSYLIPFDDVLFLGWSSLAPPTSFATGWQFLELIDLYAKERQFFDDDPTTTLEQFGLTESDFTVDEPWDQYPIVGHLLSIWNATGRYVDTCVDHAYRTDQDVQRDQELQYWIAASGKEDDGNIRGLPAMDSKDSLKRVLHSLIYRIPDPTARFDTPALLRFLPRTGTIGSMLHFTFTFWASTPYVPFVPIGGLDTDLFFDDEASNQALIELRRFIAGFIERFEPDMPQVWQWPRNIET